MNKVTETVDNILRLRLLREHLQGEDIQRIDKVLGSLRSSLGETISKSNAAELLGISRQTLDRWIEEGMLPVVERANGRQQIVVDSLESLLLDLRQIRQKGIDGKVLPRLRTIYKDAAEKGRKISDIVWDSGTPSAPKKTASGKKAAKAPKKTASGKTAAKAPKKTASGKTAAKAPKASGQKAKTTKISAGEKKKVSASEKKAISESQKKRERRARK